MTTSPRSREQSSDQLTLPLPGFHASHTVLPGSNEAIAMTVHSGRSWLGLLPQPDQPTSWLRTLLTSERWCSTISTMTWKPRVTPSGRQLFRLALSMRRIDETGCGLWPTLTVHGNNQAPKEGTDRGIGLTTFLRTLVASESKASANESIDAIKARGGTIMLSHQLRELFPTLTAQDGKNNGGPLHPEFAEWFMGFPVGWTDLDAGTGTIQPLENRSLATSASPAGNGE